MEPTMRRRDFITLLGGAVAAWPLTTHAQQPKGLLKVGWLKIQGRQHTPGQLQAFREGMRAIGMVEGRDYEIEERYADGDEARLPNLTAELLNAGVSIILATSQPSIIAAAHVTKTVPIIGRMVDDPVADGMAQSLARPAGNVTGIYTMTEELNPKRLSLLKEAVPSVRRVGVLLRRDFPDIATADHDWQVAEAAALQLGVQLIGLDADSMSKIKAAFEQISARNVDGMMTFRSPVVVTYLRQIAELCQKYHLPAVFDSSEYAEAGGLLSYGPNIDATYAQLAAYVVKLAHGASPGELPIEQPTKFELIINQHVADAIGLTLPPDLLARADRVIQ
jgi:putative ABC transport system substrate-binding protein